jgi:selenocysteine lyase/cysteine desulfurase
MVARHEADLVRPLLEFLQSDGRTTIVGPTTADADVRVPTVAFTVQGRKASEIPPILERARVAVRWGHFYAYAPTRDLNLLEQDGVVRVSMAHYNTPDEVQRLIQALDSGL